MKRIAFAKAFVLSCFMAAAMALPMKSYAQSDNYFKVEDEYNRDAVWGLTIGGMTNDNPTPLGTGLLVMVASGAGYAITRRKRSMRKGMTLLLAAAMLLGMTQCKKKVVEPSPSGKIFVTLDASCGGGRTIFDPSAPGFTWNIDGSEYMYVSGNYSGYLGELQGTVVGGSSVTNRIEFTGTIDEPSASDTKFYFFYLGNGQHAVADGSASLTLDFSDQSATGTATDITNYLIAAGEGTLTKVGDVYKAYADLQVKTAIAYFDISDFGVNETVYLHGSGVYNTATIDFKDGELKVRDSYTISGYNDADGRLIPCSDKGYIKFGTNSSKYIALIPSTDEQTTLKFDSNSKTGSITFNRGIQDNRYYSNDGAALAVAGGDLPEGALKGLFTISVKPVGSNTVIQKMARFSQSNLRYQPSTGTWAFTANQYDYVGSGNGQISNSSYTGWIDLFGWGTGTNPTNASSSDDDYSSYNEWGNNAISNGGNITNRWRDMTYYEWYYLIKTRNKCKYATICGMRGLVVLPDEWPAGAPSLDDLGTISNNSDWVNNWQNYGAILLPANVGKRRNGTTYYTGNAYYWCCNHRSEETNKAYDFLLWNSLSDIDFIIDSSRKYGYCVRLILKED